MFLYRTLLVDVRSKGFPTLTTTTLGIVASTLLCGRTAHSQFKILINISEGTTCRIGKKTSVAMMIREPKLIVYQNVKK